eukprot:3213287-Pyramimonas_sp.AAC.1
MGSHMRLGSNRTPGKQEAAPPTFVGTGAHRCARSLHYGKVHVDGEVHSSTALLGSIAQANGLTRVA